MAVQSQLTNQSWVKVAWKDFLRVYLRHRTATNRIYVLFFVGLMLSQLKTSLSGKGQSSGKKSIGKQLSIVIQLSNHVKRND
jgi:hypothetical protein